jgi:hypothetical protein
VPGRDPPRRLEKVGLGDAAGAQAVDDAVVGGDQEDVKLGDELVNVVAGVAEQRRPLGGARDVVPPRAAFEVRARAARVADAVGVGARRQGRAVGRDVVGDELAEDRPAGGAGAVGHLVVRHRRGHPERQERVVVALERRQVGEQARVAARERCDRGVDRPSGGEA